MLLDMYYRRWLAKGYDAQSFYDSSLKEVVDRLDAYGLQKKEELKLQAVQLQTLAMQIGEQVAAIMSSESVTMTPLYEWYPALFEAPNTMTNDMYLHKAQMENYAHYHNIARKKKGDG